MFEMLPGSEGKTVAVRAVGKLSDADYEALLPELEKRISTYRQINLLIDLEDFEGWRLHAAWDDFAFGMTHWHHFNKIALVGDKGWEKMVAKISNVLVGGEVLFFDLDQRDRAWAWIRDGHGERPE